MFRPHGAQRQQSPERRRLDFDAEDDQRQQSPERRVLGAEVDVEVEGSGEQVEGQVEVGADNYVFQTPRRGQSPAHNGDTPSPVVHGDVYQTPPAANLADRFETPRSPS